MKKISINTCIAIDSALKKYILENPNTKQEEIPQIIEKISLELPKFVEISDEEYKKIIDSEKLTFNQNPFKFNSDNDANN